MNNNVVNLKDILTLLKHANLVFSSQMRLSIYNKYITTYVNVQKMDCDHPLYQNIKDFPFIFFDSIFSFMTNDIIHADWTYHYRFIKRCRGFFLLSSSWHGVVDMNTKFFLETDHLGSFNLFLCCIYQDNTLKL